MPSEPRWVAATEMAADLLEAEPFPALVVVVEAPLEPHAAATSRIPPSAPPTNHRRPDADRLTLAPILAPEVSLIEQASFQLLSQYYG